MEDKWGSRPGARAPLFDRLVDEHPHRKLEPTPQRGLDPEELYASIRRELVRLLSTRCPLTGDQALSRRRTVIDYGIPDLEEGGRALVREDRMRMAKLIRQAIEAYEPRLRSVSVEVMQPPDGTGKLVVSVEALLSMEQMRAPLSFSIPLGGAEEGGDGG